MHRTEKKKKAQKKNTESAGIGKNLFDDAAKPGQNRKNKKQTV